MSVNVGFYELTIDRSYIYIVTGRYSSERFECAGKRDKNVKTIKNIFYWPLSDRWNVKEHEKREEEKLGNFQKDKYRMRKDPFRRVRRRRRKINTRQESLLQEGHIQLRMSGVLVNTINVPLCCLSKSVWLEHGLTIMLALRRVGMLRQLFLKASKNINTIYTRQKS